MDIQSVLTVAAAVAGILLVILLAVVPTTIDR